MMRGGHLPKRVGREFTRNLIWILAIFGPLAAFLFFAAVVPPVGLLAFVGICVPLLAAIVTLLVLWSGAPDERLLGSNRGVEGERGYHPGSDPTLRSGGGYGASGGGPDYGGGGGDGGGGGL